jgi:diamine N-acetyltransferase
MVSINRATAEDAALLAGIGRISFIESHGTSAAPHEINKYITDAYNGEKLTQELLEPKNLYYIVYHDKRPAGFSKIILNDPHQQMIQKNITKLERIYLLKEFYGLNLGLKLLELNLEISRSSNQGGMWLLVWQENQRAISFYEKSGFKKIGHDYYKLTETHSNPNYIMFLEY